MEPEQSTHQVTLDVTLNDTIPHKDNQQPNGNNIVFNLNKEIRNIDNGSYEPHEQNNDHQCQRYCGKVFNSQRALNTHSRTCYVRSILDIDDFLLAEGNEVNLEMQEIAEESNIRFEHLPKGLIKQGVNLPRSIQEWDLAESYFKSAIDFTSDISNTENEVTEFQSLIYNYFKDHCGLVKSEYELRYERHSKSKLKNLYVSLKVVK